MADSGTNWITYRTTNGTFKNSYTIIHKLFSLLMATSVSIPPSSLNKSCLYKTTYSISHAFIILLLSQSYIIGASVHNWTPNFYLSGKTETHPMSTLKLSDIVSTSAASTLELPCTSDKKLLFYSFLQNSTEIRYLYEKKFHKHKCKDFLELPLHKSTEFYPTSTSPISMSVSCSCEISPLAQTSTYTLEVFNEPKMIETYNAQKYDGDHLSTQDLGFVHVSENLKLLPSITHTHDPCRFHLSTKLNFHGFSGVSNDPSCATFRCQREASFCHPILYPFENVKATGAFSKYDNCVWNLSQICKLFNDYVRDHKRRFEKRKVKQMEVHYATQMEGAFAQQLTMFKYLKCFPHISETQDKKLCSIWNTKDAAQLQDNLVVNNHINIPLNLDSLLEKCVFRYQMHVTDKRYTPFDSKLYSQEIRPYPSSMVISHILEFRTAYVKSNQYFLTNLKTDQSVYCRLCETTTFQKTNVEKKQYAIMSTSTNLEFPEPQTRRTLISGRHLLYNHLDQYEVNHEVETSNLLYVSEEDELLLSILPTLAPDIIFPVPSTKYSSLFMTTQTPPYILRYEVILDHSIYYSNTWTHRKISRSRSPSLFPEPKTILTYKMDRSLRDYRMQNSFSLESSIRSFPEATVKSTDVPSIMTIAFSNKL